MGLIRILGEDDFTSPL